MEKGRTELARADALEALWRAEIVAWAVAFVVGFLVHRFEHGGGGGVQVRTDSWNFEKNCY